MLTIKELSNKLQLSRQTIHRMMKSGLPYVRVTERSVRFEEEDVMKWIKEKNQRGDQN